MRNKLFRYLIGFVYPVRCPSCGCIINHSVYMCAECRDRLEPYTADKFCNFGADEGAYFCYIYDGPARQIIKGLKFGNDITAAYAAAEEMTRKLELCGLDRRVDIIVPIPATRRKRAERGYNQCVWLAKEIGSNIGKPCSIHSFVKVRETSEQKELNYVERQENLSGCFSVVKQNELAGKRVLIVDDVSTTGATLCEAAKTIREAGASEVYAIAFAHTVKRNDK